MEDKITQTVKFIKWWATLSPAKKLATYLLSSIIVIGSGSTLFVKVLYRQIIADKQKTEVQLEDCREEYKGLQNENKTIEAEFREYLIKTNQEKEIRIRTTDSIMNTLQSKLK